MTDYPIIETLDKETKKKLEITPKEDDPQTIECQGCGKHKHFVEAVKVDTGPKIDETLWFCSKKCYTAYKL